jgi:predicted MFS family arabinose efflux permease
MAIEDTELIGPRASAATGMIIVLVCEVLVMAGFFSFPALIPTFVSEWHLSNTQAGWIAGIYFAGYVASVLFLVRMTDQLDARIIFIGSALLIAIAWAGFAWLAVGFWSGLVFRFLGGIGFAGTYMPGLRVMLDRLHEKHHRFAVTLYMAGASLGGSASFLLAGYVGVALGWQAVFFVAAAAALVAALLIALFVRPTASELPRAYSSIFDVLDVFRNRAAMGYVLAYGAHNWEIFALNSWIVAFLTFSRQLQPQAWNWPEPTTVGTAIGIVGIGAILLGGALTSRFGQIRTLSVIMLLSGVTACMLGFLAHLPYQVLVLFVLAYSVLAYADSPGLTSGVIAAAQPGRQGSTLALHTLTGFITATAAPPVVGWVLDLSGGNTPTSWGLAFASFGAVVALGPVFLRWSSHSRTASLPSGSA